MNTVAVLSLLVAVGCASAMRVKRLPSKFERMVADGTYGAHLREIRIRGGEHEATSDLYNTMYLGQMSIGTPAQNFTMILDTGSSDLWVTDSSWYGSGKHLFDASRSSTYQRVGDRWSIQYGSGAAQGFTAVDKACFTGTDYCSDKQVFGQATSLASPMDQQPIDGICGLAYKSISSLKTNPVWENILNGDNKPKYPYISVWLEELKNPTGQSGGEFTFGDLDYEHCETECDWVPLKRELWYEFNVDGIGAGSYRGRYSTAISDTGTSFLIGPPEDIEQIAQQIGAQRGMYGYTIPCEGDAPTIDVHINGKTYSVTKKNYMLEMQPGQCMVAMQGQNMPEPQWIIGDMFIREYCQVYDMQANRVGFCKAK